MLYYYYYGLPWWLIGKESTCYAGATGDMGSTPGRGRSPGGGSWQGHGNPLQYSCLENPMDRGAWQAAVHRVTKSRTWLKRLSTHTLLLYYNEETFQQVLWNADQRVFLEQKSIKLNLRFSPQEWESYTKERKGGEKYQGICRWVKSLQLMSESRVRSWGPHVLH